MVELLVLLLLCGAISPRYSGLSLGCVLKGAGLSDRQTRMNDINCNDIVIEKKIRAGNE